MSWTDERIESLRAMHAEGLPFSRIGVELRISRSAAIGKASRLGLPQREPRKNPGNRTPRPKPKHRPQKRQPWKPSVGLSPDLADLNPVPVITADDGPPENPIALLDLRNEHCRWPYGDSPFVFCGRPTANFTAGIIYCEGHRRIAYQPSQPQRERVWR